MKGLNNDLAGVVITFHQGTFESIPFGPSWGLSEYKEMLYLCFFGGVLIVGQQSSSISSGYGVLEYLYFLPWQTLVLLLWMISHLFTHLNCYS